MDKRRVVVTGLGTVNSLGACVNDFWKRSLDGTSGVRRIDEFAIPAHMSQIAGVADHWDDGPTLAQSLADADGDDRSLRFAMQATAEALADAGLGPEELARYDGRRTGVHIASAISHINRMEALYARQSRSGAEPVPPGENTTGLTNPFLFNATSAEVAKRFGLRGRHGIMATGCTGGVDAMGWALSAIRHDGLDLVIAGATDAPITPLVVSAFAQINATSTRNDAPQQASRPFNRDRDGFVLAEGCGIVVLESLESALARGARIYAEIAGFDSVNSRYHMTSMPQDGAPIVRASAGALADAGLTPDQVDFINTHGSSTPLNDVAENNAFHQLFGPRASHIPVTSIKSQTGHSLSAANAIEIVSSVMSIREGVIPPTINLTEKDPACALDVVANTARQSPVTSVLKSSSGFSGIHSSLIIRACEESAA
ncbi:beta-ketoacyl-[acyl-carrier-protein] synthase family protein [Streptomyces flavofungini]|uniref:Beta-ketoacyl-[acyl-carrier-protein] synthase family protein n=1 Tax=Streptomyces flavofungini TaxID=68200 RepID=A0ABS0XGM8_9ACTN|nr:beta-ketoacyl-[acyl-carrier-protein] synthase family protein [Streptomyces flavofungini]MBJ3812383.1 beta-ketoacyl-[acyl-carrier-protein] synthase family protein [Streptomyces flavofungini]GHC88074.1 beta-ketoacyl synthase [Streptomyces flavofungini]